ncbi:MAG: cadherin-like domain-containing protein [Sulfitobacter sp.]
MIRTIDFNNLATGETVTDQFADLGVQVSANAAGNGVDQAMIFDTNAPTGGDSDLATSNLNNVLIISEDGDSSDPDDNAAGGSLTFSFDDPVTIKSLTFLDIEETATIRFFDANGDLISEQFVEPTQNNGQSVVQLSVPGTSSFEIVLQGSGAIDNLVFEEVNEAPVAVDDVETTEEDTSVVVDLLGNDSDPDNTLDELTISDVTVDPAEGTVVDNGDGTVTFTPAEDFTGEATITYTVTDPDGLSDEGEAVVTVTPVNDAPVAVDDADVTDFNTPVTVDLLANDFDIDTDAADLSVVSATVPADQGTLTPNDDGTFEFTPADGFEGEATISYTISDGELEASAIHIVTVGNSQGPEAFDDVATTEEETPVTIDLRGNDFDPDTAVEDLIISDVTLVDPTQGELVDNGDGTVTFTPAPEFNGDATITYTVSDPEGNSDEGQAVVTVTAVNDPPVAVDDVATTEEDTAVVVNLTGNDSDPDNTVDELSVIAVSVPAEQGTIENNEDGTVTFTPAPDFNGDATITYTISDPDGQLDEAVAIVTVTPVNDAPEAVYDTDETPFETPVTIDLLANDTDVETPDALTVVSATVAPEEGTLVENADGTFEFTPADGFAGVATVTYTISDGELEDTANHFITVAESTGPEAFDDAATTDEDTPVVVDLRGNDFDPDNTLDELTISDITVDPAQGSVEDNGDGTVTFTPAPEFSGEAVITYTITDPDGQSDVGEAIITVMPVNDPPVAVDDTATTDEDTLVNITVLDDDTDPEGDFLTVTEATSDDGTVAILDDGTLDFTPNPDFFGEATINYTITDSNGGFDDAIVTVTVAPVNDAPVAVDDAETTEEETPVVVDLLGNDSDPDNTLDELTISDVTVDPAEGTVVDNGDGTVTFTPAEDFTGEATITYTVTDPDGLSDEGEAVVTVTPVNDAPVAVDDVAETEEETPVVVDLLGNDSDPDNTLDELTISDVTVDPAEGTVVDNGDGTVTFTPAEDFTGEATITYTVTDPDGLSDEGEAVVTVTPVNDAPVAVDDAETTEEETPVVVDLLGNDSDPDNTLDELTISDVTVDPAEGTVVDNGDGTVTFTPAEDFTGEATITYTVTDPDGLSDEGEAVVTVTPVNDAPVAVDDVAETDEDTPVVIDVLGNDVDPDGDLLTVTEATSPDGEVVINDDGTLEFTPTADFNGPTTITYTITDEDGVEDTATVDVTVNPVNDAPVTEDDTAETNAGEPMTIAVLDNDSDPDGDPLTVIEATSPNGTVDINDDGTIEFTPEDGFTGPAEITYVVSDGNGGETPGTVEVIVADGIVTGTDGDDLIDEDFEGDPEGDMVDGNDEFLPGEGPNDDIIEAGDGNDTVVAGEGDDEVSGGEGDDSIDGGIGDDELAGDEGNDTIAGDEGDDTVDGGTGDDVLDGGDGNDSIIGDEGNDTVVGGEGDDVIDTGNSNDPLPDIGFPGVFDPDADPEDDRDSVDGGAGNDTISTGDDRDTITGGTGDDVIDAGIDDDDVEGGAGDDRIVGGEGNDTILGGEGDDTIFANNDPDLGLDVFELEDDGTNPLGPDLAPDNGDDFVDGGAGNDEIFGGDDDDTLLGGSGDDLLDGGIDNDSLGGGTGNDTLLGGQGDDELSGGQGDDSLDGGIGDDTLFGNTGNDTLDGGEGDDSLLGGQDDDLINGDEGDDTLRGNNGNDTLNGGDGNDSIDGGQDVDLINGDDGDDTINGALGDDTLNGGDGDDSINGGSGDDLIDGGDGNDTLTGGADQDTFVNVNPGDVVDGSETGVDFDVLDLTGSAPEGGSLSVTLDDDNEENGVVDFFNADGSDAGQLVFTNIEEVIPCFTPGTLIATPKGERKVEELEIGDRIITRDNGMQEIRWIGRREMSGEELAAKEHLRPVLIREGALGNGLPERDMMVSPQHRVLIANDKTAMYFEEREVLVAAKHLTDMEGIDVVDVSHTSYIHIMFDQHEVVLSDGTWTESFQPGDLSLAGVGDASREEILELFPELATREGIEAYAAARKSLKKYEAKLITKTN